MSYSPAELIRFNLAQLRKHMLTQGCTEAEWLAGLFAASKPTIAPRDPENLEPMGPQNHPLDKP